MYNEIVAYKDIRFFEKYLKYSIGEIAREKESLKSLRKLRIQGFVCANPCNNKITVIWYMANNGHI